MGLIGVIDCDLISRKSQRFPNLACMKISAYYKSQKHDVVLIESWEDENLDLCDKLICSKVFTDTYVPEDLLKRDNILIGGTGFYFDKAKPLPDRIEHIKPDYTLYYQYIKHHFPCDAKSKKQLEYYLYHSVGFMTSGCFRQCKFCVNQNKKQVIKHSPLSEFYDESKKYICLLDDNFLGCPNWKEMLLELKATNKPFQFKQGLDERLLTDEKCELLFSCKYYGDYIFAFDKVEDYDLIESKLKMIRKYTNSEHIKFYVLCGFVGTDEVDIENTFKRIELLFRYGCFPYVMKYQSPTEKPYENSKWKLLYTYIANWCNKANLVKIMSFREFCYAMQNRLKTNKISNCFSAMCEFEYEFPEIAEKYFDMKFKKWGV